MITNYTCTYNHKGGRLVAKAFQGRSIRWRKTSNFSLNPNKVL